MVKFVRNFNYYKSPVCERFPKGRNYFGIKKARLAYHRELVYNHGDGDGEFTRYPYGRHTQAYARLRNGVRKLVRFRKRSGKLPHYRRKKYRNVVTMSPKRRM